MRQNDQFSLSILLEAPKIDDGLKYHQSKKTLTYAKTDEVIT
jgi:hypothetical protein